MKRDLLLKAANEELIDLKQIIFKQQEDIERLRCWINIEDGLPENSNSVLGYNGNSISIFYYCGSPMFKGSRKENKWCDVHSGEPVDSENGWDIKFWMPLPVAPE